MKKNAQNELIEVSDGMYKKKKRKNKAVVFGGILLVGFILYTVFSGYIVKALLGGGQERLAVGCYNTQFYSCLLYTSPSPRDRSVSRMPSSA